MAYTQQQFKIRGMHCASCANLITKKVSSLPNIKTINVNYGTEIAQIEFDPDQISLAQINDEVKKIGYSFIDKNASSADSGQTGLKDDPELIDLKQKTDFVLPIALLVFAIMVWEILAKTFVRIPNLPIPMELAKILLLILATITIFWVGNQYLQGVVRFLRTGIANMDTLVGLGTGVAYFYSAIITLLPPLRDKLQLADYTYFDVTIVVVGFITYGKYLEKRAKKKTGDAIEKLLNLQAKTALVIRSGKEIEILIQEVQHGDLIIIKPGSKIPVDGIITEGSSFIDESMVTGEPMPAQKNIGDSVVSGTINTGGSFTFKATKVGSETLLAQIIKMVENAQGSKAPIQALADKISGIFVPIVLVIAFLTLGAWLIFASGPLGFSQALSFGLVSFVSVLVIACPCALGLATPTAIIVGVGKGAREGILVKDAAVLEKLHKADTVVVDKTGTITIGKPTLTDLQNLSDLTDSELISILATLEQKSEHPIAHAIINYAKDLPASGQGKMTLEEVTSFEGLQGKGVRGIINNTEYYAGNIKLIKDLGIAFDNTAIEQFTAQGKTPVILATKNKVLGFVMVADEIKPASIQAIKDLHKLSMRVVMLTGDDEKTAKHIASLVGIDEVVAHVLPQDKLEKIKALQAQGKVVVMAGDGVNDAPALAQADVGIAMGTGTDVAIESAGITLLGGDISKLVKAIKLSKIIMRGIKQNLFWAFIYNVIGIPLAAGVFYPIFGWTLNPIFAGLAMAFSSVSVVGNSLRLKTKKL